MQQRDLPSTGVSRAVLLDAFGGPEVLDIREVPAPHAGPGQLRVRVTAAGLNPMDWIITADADTAARFGLTLPTGFGTDYAGVVDQVGDGVSGFAVGDRLFGGALSRAVADFVVIDLAEGIAANEVHHLPDGVDDRTGATLAIAGATASAALAVVDPGPHDTVLIGGAAGGVGVFAVQLACIAGARVIGTGSATSEDFLRDLEPSRSRTATAWPTGSEPLLPAVSPPPSTCTGRRPCTPRGSSASPTGASAPSPRRWTGWHRPTARTPLPTLWTRSPAW